MKLLPAAAALFMLSGCLMTKLENPSTTPGEVIDYKTTHWAGFGEDTVNVDCKKGVHKIEHGQTFGDAFLTDITAGIYNRHTVRVTCAN